MTITPICGSSLNSSNNVEFCSIYGTKRSKHNIVCRVEFKWTDTLRSNEHLWNEPERLAHPRLLHLASVPHLTKALVAE